MYFEAKANGQEFEIEVQEVQKSYFLKFRKKGEESWTDHKIHKRDYKNIDDTVSFLFKNTSYMVDVTGEGTKYTVYTRGAFRTVDIHNQEMLLHESLKGKGGLGSGDSLTSGMPGKISKVFVKAGDEIAEGEPLLIMEAMKMENEMRAAGPVRIKRVHVKEGQNVEAGATLISFQSDK